MDIVIGAVILWVVPIFVGNAIGKDKNRQSGIPLTVLFGWVGVIILLCLPTVAAPTVKP